MAFYSIDPWGGYRSDLSAAIIASTVANVGGNGTAFESSDFMPYEQMPEYIDDEIDHQYISQGFKQFFNAVKKA